MKTKRLKWYRTLYWKMTAMFLLILALIGCLYFLITQYTARHYIEEVNQKLYGQIANQTVKEVKPFVNGEVDTTAIQDIMHSMMVINPSVEVYLLDNDGHIVTYVAPYKKVKLTRVDLDPIQRFIDAKGELFIRGDDPRNPGAKKVFSAAPITEEGQQLGYAYVVLASEEQSSVNSLIFNGFMLRNGLNLFLITLFAALLVGVLAIWYLTRNLRNIIAKVQEFKDGDYSARIAENSKGDLVILADTFNDMADQIEKNIEQIQSVDNLRKELIANVSHDLRTPLSIMQGYIETILIKRKQLTEEEHKKYLSTALESSKDLAYLIDQLFEYSKLESKQITPNKEAFRIDELAQDVYVKYDILAQEKDINFEIDLEENMPLVHADIGLVERVIQNLIDNALKFTPHGGSVKLQIRTQEEGVEVKLSDTGPGIPESDQRFIFERYGKAKRGTQKAKGAGLGLAIVKRILDLHNVDINVNSKPNQGASFYFQLPIYSYG